ncbi:MAG TPA: response regulator [Armatimonadota bacterium]|jgi:CheY-like chemotaxis protein
MFKTFRESILVVDDVEENVDILVEMLNVNYEVSAAMDGETALKAANDNPPHMILLDIMMPKMDGFEVCRRLKANAVTQKIPVIFISAIEDYDSKVKALSFGGVDYICKPFNLSEVRARVDTHLELARIRRELEETLSQTLTGTIQMLSDILSMLNHELFSTASRLRTGMRAQCNVHGLAPTWSFELAGMLLPVGMLAMSPALLKKLNSGATLSNDDIYHLDNNSELSAQLLARIPRLEETAEVIRLSKLKPRELLADGWTSLNKTMKAAVLLRLLRESPNVPHELLDSTAFLPTQMQKLYGIQLALPQNTTISKPYQLAKLRVDQMKEGTILLEDIYGKGKLSKLAGEGFVLTTASMVLLSRYSEYGELDMTKTYRVSVPAELI